MASTACVDTTVKIIKVLAYISIFCLVLGSAIVAKGTLLFMTSQLKKDKEILHCNKALRVKYNMKELFFSTHSQNHFL